MSGDLPVGAGCPPIEELEAAAFTSDSPLAAHVARCTSCRVVVELIATRRTLPGGLADCARFEAFIAARAARALRPADEELLRVHVGGCDACRELAAADAFEDEVVDDLGLSPVPPDKYVVGAELARGGMGRILFARDRRMGRPVAVKELLDASPRAAARFEREARVTARLQHPGIVPIYDIGRWPSGKPFYAMRMVPGRPLHAAIDEASTVADRLALLPVVIAVAEAIAYAHSRRIIHRDLSPANVLVGSFGETVVIDWGLAKDLTDVRTADDAEAGPYRTGHSLTLTGAVVGTAAYMPPEQADGKPVDERADVYALGAILYHALAGAPPYEGRSSEEVLGKLRAGPPRPLDTSRPWRWQRVEARVTEDLRSIVEKAMARAPEDRYADAGEFVDELKRYQRGQFVRAHDYSLAARLRRWAARRRAVLVTIAILVGALTVTTTLSFSNVVRERNVAELQRRAAELQRRAAEEQRALARRTAAILLAEQGRQQLLAGSPGRALAYLAEAYRQGNGDAAVRFLIAAATRDLDTLLRTLTGHAAEIHEAAFSPDGTRVVTASGDGTARLWLTDDGSLLATLGGHRGAVRGATWSHDGARLVTWGDDGEVKRWNAQTGALLGGLTHAGVTHAGFTAGDARLFTTSHDGSAALWDATGDARVATLTPPRPPADGVRGVLSRDGMLAVTWGDTTAWVWNTATGALLSTLEGHSDGISGAAFSADGGRVATSSFDKSARVWDSRSGRLLATLVGHTASVLSVTWSPAGDRIVTTSLDRTGKLWDATAGALLASLAHRAPTHGAAFSPDGQRLVIVDMEGTARLWDGADGALLTTFEGHHGTITAAVFSPDGARVLTAGEDATARLWDARGRKRVARFSPDGHKPISGGLRYSPDGTRLFTTMAAYPPFTGAIHQMWHARSGELIHSEDEFREAGMRPGAFNQDGTRVLAYATDGRVEILDTAVRTVPARGVVLSLGGDSAKIADAVFSPDGRRLFAALVSGPPRLFDATSGQLVAVLDRHAGAGAMAAFSADGSRVLVWRGESGLHVWDARSGVHVATLDDSAQAWFGPALSPDGTRALAHTPGNALQIWDTVVGRRLFTVPEPFEASFSPDSKLLAAGGAIRDATTGALIVALESEADMIFSAEFSPDGAFLVTTGMDGIAKVWDARTGKVLASFEGRNPDRVKTHTVGGFQVPAWYARFSPDGARIATVGPGGAASVWDSRLDPRTPAEIAAFLAERVGWRVEEGRLVPVAPAP